MPDFQQFAFVSGELSPAIIGRGDLERYGLGVAEARNFFVDYRGGLSNRTGTEFLEYIQYDDKETRLWTFSYAPDVENTYTVLFGDGYIRFLQNGSYLLESAVSITNITQDAVGTVTTSGAHGFSNNDYVKLFAPTSMTELNGKTVTVKNVTSTTFDLYDQFGVAIDTSGFGTYVSGATVQRIYTVAHSYANADLAGLYFYQNRDVIRITHVDYPPAKLTRVSASSWTLADIQFGSQMDAPTGVTLTPGSSGSASVGFQITAVGFDGEESVASRLEIESASVNYTVTSGSIRVNWTAVAGAQFYNVYRTLVQPLSGSITYSESTGYVGRALGTQFVDNNIIPDFTSSPPLAKNPFAVNTIEYITVTAGGSGYAKTDGVTVSGGAGSGFVGYPIVDSTGAIAGVIVVNGGEGYTAPVTVSFTTSGGSGATATATVGPSSGTYPAVSAIFQQRYLYFGTDNNPMTIYGSKAVASFANFDVSYQLNAADAYTFDLDSPETAPIRWAVSGIGGLVVGTSSDIWLVRGAEDQVVSAVSVRSDALGATAAGASKLPPIVVDNTIVYTQHLGGIINSLVYNYQLRNYRPRDLSVQSAHLIKKGRRILHWCYITEPHFMIWAVREDGRAITVTYLPDENIVGLTQHETNGLYKDVVKVNENSEDIPYFVIQRYINGRWTKFIERGASRDITNVEDFWGIDCGLELGETYPAAALTFSAADGDGVTVTADSGVFSSSNVGDVIRTQTGRCTIVSYVNSTRITVDFTRAISNFPTSRVPEIPSGDWSISTPFSVLTGLDHLEGESVVGLADGNYVGPFTVTNGTITLPDNYSRVYVGLPYVGWVKTLPLQLIEAVVQAKLKSTTSIVVRLNETSGLQGGDALDNVYDLTFRTLEDWGEETKMFSGIVEEFISASNTLDDQIYLYQPYPLPASVIGLVTPREIEEDD